MNRRRGSIFILVSLAVLLSWWLWSRPDVEEASASATAVSQGTNAPGALTQESATLPPPEVLPEIVRDLTGERQRQREQAADRSLNEWRTPIDFYGEAVDQHGQPVEGVVATFGVTDLSTGGHSTYHATSDANGLFSLTGIRGKHLSVNLNKAGYYISNRDPRSFFYAGQNVNFVPNPAQPVVFHLHKHGEAEPLVGAAGTMTVAKDGTAIGVSLTEARITAAAGAELLVQCWTRDEGKRRGDKFDWRCVLTIPGGGIQETGEEFPFLAPEDGYLPSVEIAMPLDMESGWADKASRRYFIRLANGSYARLDFEMIPYGEHFFMLRSYVNPSGSRQLEPPADMAWERLRK